MIELTDLHRPELDMYVDKKESQLLHYYEPEPGVFIAESPNVILRAMDAGYEPLSFLLDKTSLTEKEQPILDRFPQVPVYTAASEILSQMIGFSLARGMLCAMGRKPLPSMETISKGARRIAILENVVNPTNIGAIFRSGAALGVDGILLTRGCSDPLYRRAARVSMGTVFQIPWTILEENTWNGESVEYLHRLGFKTVAMALQEDSLRLDDERLRREEKLAIVLGTEGDGLATDTIADCDYTVMIPMAHGVDSLNVAAASAVAFWELCK